MCVCFICVIHRDRHNRRVDVRKLWQTILKLIFVNFFWFDWYLSTFCINMPAHLASSILPKKSPTETPISQWRLFSYTLIYCLTMLLDNIAFTILLYDITFTIFLCKMALTILLDNIALQYCKITIFLFKNFPCQYPCTVHYKCTNIRK